MRALGTRELRMILFGGAAIQPGLVLAVVYNLNPCAAVGLVMMASCSRLVLN